MPATTIRCPAKSGRQHLQSIEECLICAGDDPPCQYTQAILLAMYAFEAREGIHVTSLLSCPRQTILKSKIEYSIDPFGQWHLLRGKMAHLVLEQSTKGVKLPKKFLEIIEVGPKVKSELSLSIVTNGRKVQGTLDEYVEEQAKIRDYKSTAKIPTWNKPWKNHIDQINIYTVLCEANSIPVKSAEVVYFDLTDAKKVPCPLYPKEEREELLKQRLSLYIQSEKNIDQSVPEREWACKFCPPEIVTACMRIDLKNSMKQYNIPMDQIDLVINKFSEERNLTL